MPQERGGPQEPFATTNPAPERYLDPPLLFVSQQRRTLLDEGAC
jgi:hypothetical protein